MGRWLGLAVAAASLAAGVPRLSAQAAPAGDVRAELRAIRESLDQLVAVLRELERQNARRDVVAAQLQRIAVAEKSLAPLQEEARVWRQRRQSAEEKLGQAERSFVGLQEMEKVDVTGSASAAFEAERSRLNGEVQRHNGTLAEVSQELAALERDLAARRQAIDELYAQLERLLSAEDESKGGTRAK